MVLNRFLFLEIVAKAFFTEKKMCSVNFFFFARAAGAQSTEAQ